VRPLIAKLASRPDDLGDRDVEACVQAMQLAAAQLIDEGVIGGDDDVQATQVAEPTAGAAFKPMDVVGGAPCRLQRGAASAPVQPRVASGQELRATLKEILSLESSRKLDAARELETRAQAEPELSEEDTKRREARRAELAKKRAQEMRTQFFSLGNWHLTASVLNRFLDTPEVQHLLPGSRRQIRADRNDAGTAGQLLAAAKSFFGDIMHSKGRRTETDMNAFWVAVSALIPKDLLENRGGRAATRILGMHHRVVEKGAEVRAELGEHGQGWCYREYNGHRGRVDLQILNDWWQTEDASTEDNQNEQPFRVYHQNVPR